MGYLLSGTIFYVFGLKWCYQYSKYWISHPDIDYDREPSKLLRFSRAFQRVLNRHPIEGTLKLLATALGLASTFTGNLPSADEASPKVAHATIYLFFALSGLVDVLTFYFPNVVGDGLAKMALAQGFFIEGLLFLWGNSGETNVAHGFLTGIVWTTSFAIVLELVWVEMKLLRAASTLLHGTWLAHMVGNKTVSSKTVALSFSWHVAAAFAVMLCLVAITRSCAPKHKPNEPPDIPIYDYCHEPDQRA